MTDTGKTTFVETREYRRFREFCNDCRRNRHIGLCHGPPGVGKTLSARRFTHWDEIESLPYYGSEDITVSDGALDTHTVLYTAPVSNSPGKISRDLEHLRSRMLRLSRQSKDIMDQTEVLLQDARRRDRLEREAYFARSNDWRVDSFWFFPRSEPTVQQLVEKRCKLHDRLNDPTKLIIIDEADRLKI